MRVERKPKSLPVEKPSTGANIIDVLDHVLDKGVVIESYVQMAVAGIDLITVRARVLVASTETYLQHAKGVNNAATVWRAV
jgi:hypothetical protein